MPSSTLGQQGIGGHRLTDTTGDPCPFSFLRGLTFPRLPAPGDLDASSGMATKVDKKLALRLKLGLDSGQLDPRWVR